MVNLGVLWIFEMFVFVIIFRDVKFEDNGDDIVVFWFEFVS